MRVGLNPYGLTWVLGLQGRGTPRNNPAGRGVAGLLDIADELGAKVVEIFDPWLRELPDAEVAAIGARLAGRDQTPVVSAGIDMMGPMESAFRSARLLGARTIRLGLSPILCGDRNAAGARWGELNARIREVLAEWGPRADDAGYRFGIENHQDFTSAELVAFCEMQPRHRHHPRHRQHLPRGRGAARLHPPRRAAHRAHPPQGLPGAVHRGGLSARALRHRRRRRPACRNVAPSSRHANPEVTAVLEPGALEARHVRLFTSDWWNGYAPRTAAEFAACLRAARVNKLPADADYRTPWERQEDGDLETYELDMIRRSAANMRALGIM